MKLLHGDCDCDRQNHGANLAGVADIWQVRRPSALRESHQEESHLIVLKGTRPGRCSGKVDWEGRTRSPDPRACSKVKSVPRRRFSPAGQGRNVVVIRGEGPVGGPGMREMLVYRRHHGSRAGRQGGVDYRWTVFRRQPWLRGGSSGPRGAPGPIGLLKSGDMITIDARRRSIVVALSAAILQAARSRLAEAAPIRCGVLGRYAGCFQCQSGG
jgi:dihydroxy-acid dehydratase